MSDMMTRAASLRPSTISEADRSVTLSWGRGAPVDRRDARGQLYVEELDMSADAVNLDVLAAGASLLDSHRTDSILRILGTVEAAWLEDGEGFARVRFSERPDVDPVWRDVVDGHIKQVSVGYTVSAWAESRREGALVKKAVRWTPRELSLVVEAADPSARVRASNQEGKKMPEEHKQASPVAALIEVERAAPPSQGADRRVHEIESVFAAVADKGVERSIAERLKDTAIALGRSADDFKAALWEASLNASRSLVGPDPRPVAGVGFSNDDPSVIRSRMAAALADAMRPGLARAQGDAGWQQYRGLKPSDMLVALAQARGERDAWRHRPALIERAFHTTSDFPEILAAAANKVMAADYATAQPTYREIFEEKPFADFKPHRHVAMGDFPSLTEMGEGGEIVLGTVNEKRETIAPKTFSVGITLTRQMLVNDDLGAFADFTSKIGRRVADDENRLAFELLGLNNGDGPLLTDGNARVFASGRGNKAGTPGAITIPNLGAARAAIMKQTTLGGLPISIGQQMRLLVGPDKELEARQVTATITPNQSNAVNPYAGFIQVVVDPLVPGNRWYLFAQATTPFVYGFVAGQRAPRIRAFPEMAGYDGLRIDVVHDFGVGAVDWRGAYYNPGA